MKRMTLIVALALSVLIAPVALAQSDLGLKGVGGAIGYVNPEDLDGALLLGVFADCGTIAPKIGLEARLDYWSQSESAPYTDVSVRDIVLGARAKYHFDVSHSSIRPFAGAGLGLHFVAAEATTSVPGFPTTTADDSESRIGLDLGGGIATAMGPRTDFLGEAWYAIVSDVSHFSLRAGLSYRLK